jgi:hypothetical protein
MVKSPAILFCMLLVPVPASAQQIPANIHVPAEMNKLYLRVGTWQATIRSMPGPGSPEGGVDHGMMVIRKGPGGFSIVQDFQSHGSSGHLVGQSYTWWDNRAKTYESVWCDNMEGCTAFPTTMQGDSWTVELDSTANGRKVHTTIHATLSEDRNCIHEVFTTSYDGGPPRTVTVSDYRRVIPDLAREEQPTCGGSR